MRLQRFADVHEWTVIGEINIQKDHFSRSYADGVRVLLVRPEGAFTALICADGQRRYVMTSDWDAVGRLAGVDNPTST